MGRAFVSGLQFNMLSELLFMRISMSPCADSHSLLLVKYARANNFTSPWHKKLNAYSHHVEYVVIKSTLIVGSSTK